MFSTSTQTTKTTSTIDSLYKLWCIRLFCCFIELKLNVRNFLCVDIIYKIQKKLTFLQWKFWHLLHHWNRRKAIHLKSRQHWKHNKRLYNAQFINHTTRTIAQHKYLSHSALVLSSFNWGFSSFQHKQYVVCFVLFLFYVQHVFTLCFSTFLSLSFLGDIFIFSDI